MNADVERVLFIAGVVPMCLAIEALFPRERARPKWRALALALGLMAFNSLLGSLVAFSPSGAAAPLVRVYLAWLLAELFAYWLHRAMHTVPLLWRIHRMHHSPEPIAFHRSWWIHPIDLALFVLSTSIAVTIAGAPMFATTSVFLIARRVWGILLHANVRWPATFLDHVIVTPAVHYRHHREDLPAANFAPSFSILDRAFGTWSR